MAGSWSGNTLLLRDVENIDWSLAAVEPEGMTLSAGQALRFRHQVRQRAPRAPFYGVDFYPELL